MAIFNSYVSLPEGIFSRGFQPPTRLRRPHAVQEAPESRRGKARQVVLIGCGMILCDSFICFFLLDSSAFIVVLFLRGSLWVPELEEFPGQERSEKNDKSEASKKSRSTKKAGEDRTEPRPLFQSHARLVISWGMIMPLKHQDFVTRETQRERENRHTWQAGDGNSTPWIIFVNFSALPAKEENTTWQRWQEQLPLSCISTLHPWR